jgi:ABC-type branched-subunit amino acid transport system ATPase component/sugar phosphate permease
VSWASRRLSSITGGAPWYPLVILFGLNAVDELDRTAFGILIPEIREEFGLDLSGILGLIALVTLGALLLQVPVAAMADRSNRVLIAGVGAFGWACFSFMTGLAGGLLLLGIARTGSGIGKAVVEPTHNSLLADYYDLPTRPRVYSFHRAANAVGAFVGPLAAGLMAAAWGWRAPFLVYAVPTLIFVALSRRMQEPIRGIHERRAMGLDDEAAAHEEPSPSFAEAWRIVNKIPTLRRIFMSLPFLAASLIGFVSLASLLYAEVFDLDERARGFAAAAAEPAQLVGLLIGARVGTRLLAKGPDHVLGFLSHVAWGVSAALIGFALAPTLAIAIGLNMVISGALAVLTPGIFTVLAASIPPRARSMGFAVASLWVIPGLLILPVIGWLGDRTSLRVGLLAMVPAFFVGGVLIARTKDTVVGDIAEVWQATAARATDAAERERGKGAMLTVRNLDVAYGSVQVLFGVSLDVQEGECLALLGTNGAGKSTLLRAIGGVVEADRGVVLLDGREVTHAPPEEIAALGVAQVPGGQGVFASLTVAENLRVSTWLADGGRSEAAARIERAYEIFPILRDRADGPAGDLSGGQQQMLALAMALTAKPKLLLIDELSLGLAPAIVAQLLPLVEEARAQGTTVVLVEQSVNIALQLAQTAVFMEKGEIRFVGPTADLLDRTDVLRSVFLEGASTGFGETNGNGKAVRTAEVAPAVDRSVEPILRTVDMSVSFGGIRAVSDVSLSVVPGESVGIIGPNGAGKTTFFDLVSGFLVADGGSVFLNGVDISNRNPAGRAMRGLGRSFQDAKLFPSMTVAEVIAVACERWITSRDPLSAALHLPNAYDAERGVAHRVDELLDLLQLGRYRAAFVRELSTGTRRVVDLACLLAHRPSVILLDEPSSGVAQRETEALGPLLRRIREGTGAALVVIEHDMPLLRSVCDRLVAMDQGVVIADGLSTDVLHDPAVVASYLGTSEAAIERSIASTPGGTP